MSIMFNQILVCINEEMQPIYIYIYIYIYEFLNFRNLSMDVPPWQSSSLNPGFPFGWVDIA